MPFWKKDLIWSKPKKKKKNPEDKIWTSLSKYIRLRDCLCTMGRNDVGRCISCNKIIPYKGNDGWHFITRSSEATKYDVRNVHLQCSGCNRFQQWAWDTYYMAMQEIYWQEVIDELLKKKYEIFKGEHKDHLYWNQMTKKLYNAYLDWIFWQTQIQIKQKVWELRKKQQLEIFIEKLEKSK